HRAARAGRYRGKPPPLPPSPAVRTGFADRVGSSNSNSRPHPQSPRVSGEGSAMPIFMDRHDMCDMTAEAIAAAHRRDLEVQDKYGVKYMTYWFDQVRGTGFCLVD